ncbi:MAG: hypothetical protein ACSHXJ_17430 [Marinomonas colpomeniae]
MQKTFFSISHVPYLLHATCLMKKGALYEIASMCLFAGLSLGGLTSSCTGVMSFRHLLEKMPSRTSFLRSA